MRCDPRLPHPALLVLGPFMHSDRQAEFLTRAAKLDKVEAITFDAQMEHVMSRAIGVVAMGGYNTFCEIVSFDKRALIVPRTRRAWNSSCARPRPRKWASLPCWKMTAFATGARWRRRCANCRSNRRPADVVRAGAAGRSQQRQPPRARPCAGTRPPPGPLRLAQRKR